MYPSTTFELVDKSGKVSSDAIPESIITEVMVSSTDKGPEEMLYVRGDTFYELFGKNISFVKHGQPLIQAANAIDNGATLLFKRLVADDATLANIAILAKVYKEVKQKTDENKSPLYIDPVTGKETTDPGDGNEPAVYTRCKIKYSCETVLGSKDIDQDYETISKKLIDDSNQDDDTIELTEYVYPLIVIADIGRGVSKKRIRISPDYKSSKYKSYMKYELSVIEDNTIIERKKFLLDPDYIENNENKSLEHVCKKSYQIRARLFEENFVLFLNKVSHISGLDYDYLIQNDIFFGRDKSSGNPIENLYVDLNEGFNLSFIYGIDLTSGSNGTFGEKPFGTKEWEIKANEFFGGEYDPRVYDLNNTPMDIVIDANYPKSTKLKIEEFVMFREDLIYLRDNGIGLTDISDIFYFHEEMNSSRYIVPYIVSYDVIDQYSRKQVPVTIGYSLARIMVNHFKNGRNRPLAGFLHDFIIPEAIENTINFLPSITPNMNEKQELDDARLNYCSYYENTLVIETFYTTQVERTDFSYANNILAVQELMKAIRKRCPHIRYSFTNGDDLSTYQDDVNAVINKYAGNFHFVEMQYAEDPSATDEDRVYYAVIYVSFRPFVQAEKFKIIALPTATTREEYEAANGNLEA